MGPKVLPKHTFATKQKRIEYLIDIVKKPLVPQTTDIDSPPPLPNQLSQKPIQLFQHKLLIIATLSTIPWSGLGDKSHIMLESVPSAIGSGRLS